MGAERVSSEAFRGVSQRAQACQQMLSETLGCLERLKVRLECDQQDAFDAVSPHFCVPQQNVLIILFYQLLVVTRLAQIYSANCTGCMRRSPAWQAKLRDPRYRKSPHQADESTKKDVLRITETPVAQFFPDNILEKLPIRDVLSKVIGSRGAGTRAIHCLWRWLVRKR